MASPSVSNFPAFRVFPTLNPTMTWRVAAVATDHTVSVHRNLELAVRKAERLNVLALLHEAVAPVCCFLDERHEYACGNKSTVAEIETGNHFCAKHGEMVLA